MMEYLNELRESILSAYTGIIQGMKAENAVSLIEPHLPFLLEFVRAVASDNDNSDDVVCACVALIGCVKYEIFRRKCDALHEKGPYFGNYKF